MDPGLCRVCCAGTTCCVVMRWLLCPAWGTLGTRMVPRPLCTVSPALSPLPQPARQSVIGAALLRGAAQPRQPVGDHLAPASALHAAGAPAMPVGPAAPLAPAGRCSCGVKRRLSYKQAPPPKRCRHCDPPPVAHPGPLRSACSPAPPGCPPVPLAPSAQCVRHRRALPPTGLIRLMRCACGPGSHASQVLGDPPSPRPPPAPGEGRPGSAGRPSGAPAA